jgi:hypothetical protein
MDEACNKFGEIINGDKSRKTLKKKEHFEDLGIDGRIILKLILSN